MATKTLNITEEAFELLKAQKGPNESFTDVIKRLAGDRSLEGLVGLLSSEKADALERSVLEGRKRSRSRRARQAKEW